MSVIHAVGRCSITIDDRKAVIFTGIRSFGLTRQFAVEQLTEVILAGTRNEKGYLRRSIVVNAGKRIDFATLAALLTDDQCAFVAAAIVLSATNQEQQGTIPTPATRGPETIRDPGETPTTPEAGRSA